MIESYKRYQEISKYRGEFVMGSILLFSVVVAIAAAVIIVPLTSAKGEEEKGKSLVVPALLFAAVIGAIVIALAYYFLNIDRNLTSLWPVLAVAAGLGALFSK